MRCAWAVALVGVVACAEPVAPTAWNARSALRSADVGAAEVLFSPTEYARSHVARAVQRIDDATRSIDLAMYSLRDASVVDAIERARSRSVEVRAILHAAARHRRDPAGTLSADLEDLGVEVRWIHRTMHHKFLLVDGPRDRIDEARDAVLLSGSANWSSSAVSAYDEATVDVVGDLGLILRFQREFDLLWRFGRDVAWRDDVVAPPTLALTTADLDAAGGTDAWFTSDNFDPYVNPRWGGSFRRVVGRRAVADRLVAWIDAAQTSLDVASGHLRSRPIAEAIVRAHQRGVSVRVYLDGQEYVSGWWRLAERRAYADCLDAAAGDAHAADRCDEQGAHFGAELAAAGVPTRFKHYAYKWNIRYAAQMHHKYLIADGRSVAAGSYNLSPNAEFATMENLVVWDGANYPGLVVDFQENFDEIWNTGRDGDSYGALLDEVRSGSGSVPLVFEPMALTSDDIMTLRNAVRDACPAVLSDGFWDDANPPRVCDR